METPLHLSLARARCPQHPSAALGSISVGLVHSGPSVQGVSVLSAWQS